MTMKPARTAAYYGQGAGAEVEGIKPPKYERPKIRPKPKMDYDLRQRDNADSPPEFSSDDDDDKDRKGDERSPHHCAWEVPEHLYCIAAVPSG
jgi:hypothetical protein